MMIIVSLVILISIKIYFFYNNIKNNMQILSNEVLSV